MSRSSHFALCAVAALAACAGPGAPPLAPPELDARLSYFVGSIRSGPRAQEEASGRKLEDALSIEYGLTYFESLPSEALTPLPERTEVVLVARGGELLQPTSALARGARIGVGDSAQALRRELAAGELGPTAQAAHEFGVLPRGVTSVFRVRFPQEVRVPGEGTARRGFAVQLARARTAAEDELGVALVIEDLATLPSAAKDGDAGAAAGAGQRVLQREHVLLLDRPTVDGAPIVLTVRSPALGPDAGFALWIDVRSSGALGDLAARHASAFERAEAELTRASAQAIAFETAMPQSDLYRREVGEVFQALDLQPYSRSALVFLAGSTGAELAQDLALVSEEADLSAWSKLVVEQSQGRDVRISDAAGVGWLLERSACLFAASRMDGAGLPAELRASVLAHAGEVGRSSGSLQSAALESADLAAFRARLVEENWISLADAQPAARVRAFDWLRKRGLAPEGFDPLGSREERRVGLQRALDAKEARAQGR